MEIIFTILILLFLSTSIYLMSFDVNRIRLLRQLRKNKHVLIKSPTNSGIGYHLQKKLRGKTGNHQMSFNFDFNSYDQFLKQNINEIKNILMENKWKNLIIHGADPLLTDQDEYLTELIGLANNRDMKLILVNNSVDQHPQLASVDENVIAKESSAFFSNKKPFARLGFALSVIGFFYGMVHIGIAHTNKAGILARNAEQALALTNLYRSGQCDQCLTQLKKAGSSGQTIAAIFYDSIISNELDSNYDSQYLLSIPEPGNQPDKLMYYLAIEKKVKKGVYSSEQVTEILAQNKVEKHSTWQFAFYDKVVPFDTFSLSEKKVAN